MKLPGCVAETVILLHNVPTANGMHSKVNCFICPLAGRTIERDSSIFLALHLVKLELNANTGSP